MPNTKAFGRLLWKELREGWLVLAAAAMIPTVAIPLASLPVTPDIEKVILRYIGVLCSPLLIVVWAAKKGSQKRDEGKSALAHLPVSRTAQWLIPIAVPWLMTIVVGAWYGFISGTTRIDSQVVGWTMISSGKLDAGTACMLGIYILSTAFAGCYLISAAASPWAAIICGAIWSLAAPDWTTMGNWSPHVRQNTLEFIAKTSNAAVGCLALFITLSFARRVRFTASRVVTGLVRAVPIVLLVGLVFGPFAREWWMHRHGIEPPADFGVLLSADRSLMVSGTPVQSDGKTRVDLVDQRTERTLRRNLQDVARAVAFDGRNRLFFAQQLRGENLVRIYSWDVARDRIEQVAAMTAPRINRFVMPEWANQVSPGGRYVVVLLPSWAGPGTDIWVVDTIRHTQWIALPNEQSLTRQLSWYGNRLTVSGLSSIRTVDLDTRRTEDLHVRAEHGGQI